MPFLLATTALAQQPLRIWGDTDMAAALTTLEAHYQQHHPEARFDNHLIGTDTAMGALYGGLADIALLGREPNQTEHDGFLHSLQYEPLQLHFLTGALDAEDHTFAPVVFVHKENPLAHLTLAQLQRAFGCGKLPPARTWGDLGLTGAWATRPLHLYAFDMESGTGTFFLEKIQGPSKKMNWPNLREFRDIESPDHHRTAPPAGKQIIAALLADPNGLAVSGLHYAQSPAIAARLKPIALSSTEGSPYILPTRATLIDGSYPLARMTYVFVNQLPNQPVPPAIKNFLQFVYSEEGQQIIAARPDFLPLSRSDAASEASKLNGVK